MVRQVSAWLLVAMSIGLATVAVTRHAPRGLIVTEYASTDWSGEPTREALAEQVDFGPDLIRNPHQLRDNTSVTFVGYIDIPRSGTYGFGLDSTDTAFLSVADKPVLTHRRGQAPSEGAVALEPGLTPIRLRLQHKDGPSELFLLWRPPGADALVPVSPVLLHPDDSQPANDPMAWVHGALLAGGLGLGLLLLPGVRRAIAGFERPDFALAAALPTLALAVWTPVVLRMGETRDEWLTSLVSRLSISNLLHGYFQSAYSTLGSRNPPLGYYLYGLVGLAPGGEGLVAMRIVAALCGALTVLAVVMFALRRYGRFSALIAGGLLVVLPPFVGFTTTATLDAPGCLTFTLAAIYTISVLHERPTSSRILKLGLVVGVAMGTRFTGGFALLFVLLLHLAHAIAQHRRRGHATLPLALVAAPVLAASVVFLTWPWLWRSPFGQALATMRTWDYTVTESFLGSHGAPPLGYLPVQFLASVPSLVILAGLVGVFGALRPLPLPPQFDGSPSPARVDWVVLLWGLVPFLAIISDLEADGARHLLASFPPLVLLAARGLERFIPKLSARPTAGAALLAYTAWQAVAVFPHLTTYRSDLVGGTYTAWRAGLFPSALLGEGVEEAAAFANDRLANGGTWRYEGPSASLATRLIRPSARHITSDAAVAADVVVRAAPEPGQEVMVGYLPALTVSVDGAPLVVVFLRDGSEVFANEQKGPVVPPPAQGPFSHGFQ